MVVIFGLPSALASSDSIGMNSFLSMPRMILLIAGLQLASLSARAHQTADEMAAAANKFLTSLNADQKAKAQFDFKADERLDWHYIPKDS